MPQYCKAYKVEDLRRFVDWEKGDIDGLSDEDICFVWEDFTVAKSCFDESKRIFPEVTEQWKEFCTETLKFEIPDDLKESPADSQRADAQLSQTSTDQLQEAVTGEDRS